MANPLYYRFDSSGTGISAAHPLPVTQADMGALDDAAWDGSGDPTSVIALWKGIMAQLVAINANTAA
jgi:hypothetical protein